MMERVKMFRGEYYFLSNFYPVEITVDGLTYQNAEAAFQAQKCLTEEEKRQFCSLSGNQAKHLGRKVALRPDWEQVKDDVMRRVVGEKFRQHPALAIQLIATGDAILQEGNTWNDTYWGVSLKTGRGKNRLGGILMQLRKELMEG